MKAIATLLCLTASAALLLTLIALALERIG